MASIQDRLQALEESERLIDWFLAERFMESFNQEQLETMDRERRWPEPLPEPLPKGASRLDKLDRKSLIKLWKESERMFGRRSRAEMEFYAKSGYWPEQRMWPRYFLQDGCVSVEWQVRPLSSA